MSEAALFSLLEPLVSPAPLIFAEQNGPRPTKPYATLAVRSVDPSARILGPVDESGDVEVIQQLQISAELQVYGWNALAAANLIGLKLRFPTTASRAQELGIGISRVDRALRVPDLLDQSQYEERAILEFSACTFLSATDNVGVIENVEFDCFGHNHTV